jgi:capsid protein
MRLIQRIMKGLRAYGTDVAHAPRGRRVVQARYDAAQTGDDNRRHWAMADGLTADQANSPAVRRTIRNRARYEVANNGFAAGICQTLANDTVGTGPRLQLTGIAGPEARLVERLFAEWSDAIDLAEKLRMMRYARAVDGEVFGLIHTNAVLPFPVQLDVRPIEADLIATPGIIAPTVDAVDGILLTPDGVPRAYHLLRTRPGDLPGFAWKADEIPAADMVHALVPTRPGQHRAVSEFTPTLHIFAMLRRYTQAVLAAAETAADFAAVLYTDAPANGEADAVEPMDRLEIAKRMMTTMPAGWKMEQFRPEQPTSNHEQFLHANLTEGARPWSMPLIIALGNSSGANYASGRLDHQVYYKALKVDQARWVRQVLNRVFAAWVHEAILVEGFLPQRMRTVATDWAHQWFWDGHEHVDPQKEANAQATRLASRTTTLADEYARKGQDWEVQLRQLAREQAVMRELGLATVAAPAPAPKPDPTSDPVPSPDSGEESE